jgi:cytochrome c oxidase subunit 2
VRSGLVAAAVLVLSGCGASDLQSALHPRGPAAADIDLMGRVMTVGAALVFLVTMAALAAALLDRRRHDASKHRSRWLVIGGGAVFPTVVLGALLAWTSWLGAGLARPPADADLTIRVTGRMWWWEVAYRTPDGEVVAANEVRIPVGRPVALELVSDDVIHSFWVPSLHGKMDMIPGRTNRFVLTADEPVTLRGQCAEYCGLQHALMAFTVVAMAEADFAAWLAAEARPIAPPADALGRDGMRAFLKNGCGACHTVRGAEWNGIVADGRLGPDLTHVGSRGTIGAGTLGNGVGPLAAWIASTQHLKPGAKMPSFDVLDGPTLRAVSGWLAGLE